MAETQSAPNIECNKKTPLPKNCFISVLLDPEAHDHIPMYIRDMNDYPDNVPKVQFQKFRMSHVC